jgi:hypothetical protein
MVQKWQQFQRRTARIDRQVPRVTIQKDGNIGVNRAAMELIGVPDYIVYLLGERGKVFGIAASTGDDVNAYPIRAQANETSFVASAKLFLQWADIPFGERPQFFTPELDDDVLVIDVRHSSDTGGKSSSRHDAKENSRSQSKRSGSWR